MLTQSNHWNYVKAAICESSLTGMDMVCCHPTLLVQIFEHCGQHVPVLTRIKDRDKVQKQTGLCKRLFKKYLLSVLYYPHADDAAVKRKLQKYSDSGKGMLVTLLENCYGSELVCTVNGESFLHTRSDADENMKLGQLGMFDCEWARLAVSSVYECGAQYASETSTCRSVGVMLCSLWHKNRASVICWNSFRFLATHSLPWKRFPHLSGL
jgi:hypothetical protein